MKKLIVATLLAAVQITFAGSKTAPDLPKTAGLNLIEVIVQFKNLPTKDDLKQLGPYGQMKQLNIVNGVHLWLPPNPRLPKCRRKPHRPDSRRNARRSPAQSSRSARQSIPRSSHRSRRIVTRERTPYRPAAANGRA